MPRPRGPALLSRERIVDAALALVDRDGLDALSMRHLARDLGVDPMSIYHHVPNKDALLRALVERVVGAMAVPPSRGEWKRRVRRWAEAYRAVAVAHPNLVLRIVSDPATVAVAAVAVNESLYRALEDSGLPPKAIVGIADTIVDYVNGATLALATPLAAGVDEVAAFEAELLARPEAETATQRRLFADPTVLERRDGFRFGLDLILAGVEHRFLAPS